MSHGSPEPPPPSSDPETLTIPMPPIAPPESQGRSVSPKRSGPVASFGEVEGPTLSSPSSDPKLHTTAALGQRIEELETRLISTEEALGDVCSALEELMKSQDSVNRAMREQRLSRYLMWGTLIAILGVFWLILHARAGSLLPR